jgi:hypothetical protein
LRNSKFSTFLGIGRVLIGKNIGQRTAYCFSVMLLSLPSPALAQLQTSVAPAPPSLTQGETGSADTIYCRPPQHRTDSQLMGPKVCMTIKKWNDLHAAGLDIGADGNPVSSEKHLNMLSH